MINHKSIQLSDLFMTSSKDVVHILRLATVIGILERYLMESLNPDLVDEKELPMGKKIISFCSVKKYGIYILLTISTTHDKIFCSHRITT
jgi:hypothetical protein